MKIILTNKDTGQKIAIDVEQQAIQIEVDENFYQLCEDREFCGCPRLQLSSVHGMLAIYSQTAAKIHVLTR